MDMIVSIRALPVPPLPLRLGRFPPPILTNSAFWPILAIISAVLVAILIWASVWIFNFSISKLTFSLAARASASARSPSASASFLALIPSASANCWALVPSASARSWALRPSASASCLALITSAAAVPSARILEAAASASNFTASASFAATATRAAASVFWTSAIPSASLRLALALRSATSISLSASIDLTLAAASALMSIVAFSDSARVIITSLSFWAARFICSCFIISTAPRCATTSFCLTVAWSSFATSALAWAVSVSIRNWAIFMSVSFRFSFSACSASIRAIWASRFASASAFSAERLSLALRSRVIRSVSAALISAAFCFSDLSKNAMLAK